jgi:hypothetical protein
MYALSLEELFDPEKLPDFPNHVDQVNALWDAWGACEGAPGCEFERIILKHYNNCPNVSSEEYFELLLKRKAAHSDPIFKAVKYGAVYWELQTVMQSVPYRHHAQYAAHMDVLDFRLNEGGFSSWPWPKGLDRIKVAIVPAKFELWKIPFNSPGGDSIELWATNQTEFQEAKERLGAVCDKRASLITEMEAYRKKVNDFFGTMPSSISKKLKSKFLEILE